MAHDGQEGLALFKANHYSLVILDIMLSGMDGLDICKAIRAMQFYVPVLMLTAKSTELDRVLGLELGADDYLTKPFSILELMARIKALFRRVEAMQEAGNKQYNDHITHLHSDAIIRIRDIEINTLARTVKVLGDDITLTAKEFDLLYFLLSILVRYSPGHNYSVKSGAMVMMAMSTPLILILIVCVPK